MRKIKKFKIPIYHYDIYRKAKKYKIDIENSHIKNQEGLKEFTSIIASAIEPATVFDYIKNDSPLWQAIKIENKQFAATLGLFTLGKKLDEKINSLTEDIEKELAKISAEVFINTGINIISELVNEEAKKDGFEISKPVYLYTLNNHEEEKNQKLEITKDLLNEILIKLEAEKIGVTLENETLIPNWTTVFTIGWFSKKKR